MRKKEQLTEQELAEAYIITEKLSKSKKLEADADLNIARKKSGLELRESDRLSLRLMQMRFQIEDYLKNSTYDNIRTFGYFLKEYLHIINMKRMDFAKAIRIHETELSNIINNRRLPSSDIMVRLEIQSDNYFPAVYSLKLVEKQKVYELETDSKLRKNQARFVDKTRIITAYETTNAKKKKILQNRVAIS